MKWKLGTKFMKNEKMYGEIVDKIEGGNIFFEEADCNENEEGGAFFPNLAG